VKANTLCLPSQLSPRAGPSSAGRERTVVGRDSLKWEVVNTMDSRRLHGFYD
jgi:hypothetical protein